MDLKVCRICGGVEKLKNILDHGTGMMYKLLVCTNINISYGDLLPKFICEQCDINLELSYRLRKQSEDTQKRLKLEIVGVSAENDNLNRECGADISNCKIIYRSEQSEQSNKSFEIERNIGESCAHHKIDPLVYREEQESILEPDEKKGATIYQKIGENCIIIDNEVMESCNPENNDRILDCPKNNNVEILNAGDDNWEKINLEETIEIPVVSEYYSIDLLSSSSSSSGHDIDFEVNNIENSLTCNTCNEHFIKKKDYRIHIKQHGEDRYQCIQCCKFFPTRFRLKRHEETHNEIPDYNCPHCKRSYRALYNLNRHIRSAHLAEKSLDCKICNVSFSRADVLKRHLQLHSEEKNYSCLLCSRSFKTRDYLNAHVKTHHSGKPVASTRSKRSNAVNTNRNQCGHCGMLLRSSFAYKNHLLIHTNEKPYKCESCNKRFRTIAALTTHQRIHDDYRPYQCDLCLKSFKQTAHLKEHKLLHSGSSPQHICSICQASFNKKSNLKAHMRIHTKEKPFKCADCSSEFAYMHLLQRHASKVHNRSAHKVYIINESDETTDVHDIVESNGVLESELYIDTVSDSDLDHNVTHIVDLIEDNHVIYGISPELEILNNDSAIEQIKFDTGTLDSQTVLDCVQVHSRDSIQSQPHETLINCVEDHENHIIEQKVDLFVSEETMLTSSTLILNELTSVKK